jgi:TorA maturation chaperone TorD
MLEYLASCLEMGKVRPQISTSEKNCGHFIQTELLTWLPAFMKRANETATATDLYKAVIALTVDYLEGLVNRPG